MRLLKPVGGLVVVAAVVWAAIDAFSAVLVLAVGLLFLLLRHYWHLASLAHHVETFHADALPLQTEKGVWGQIYWGLHRQRREEKARDLLQRSNLERFRSASQAMPDGVVFLSGTDTIEWLNTKAERHFGLDQQHDHGICFTALVRQPELLRYVSEGLDGEPLLIHSPRRPDVKLMIQLVPFGDQRKMLVSRDITQLEKLENMRRDFIANVSHELRTPLSVIGGFVETLLHGLEDFETDEVRRFLGLAQEQSGRMQRLIEDLLTLAVLESGELATIEEEVDVVALLQQVLQETKLFSAGKHVVRLEIAQQDEGDVLLGERKVLLSAFSNLTTNAVRYTPAGGEICLLWQHTQHGAEYVVSDNGIGIAAHHLPRLTERFFRVDRGRSRESGGTGLGLAIVKHAVSRHQANLVIESSLNQGSRFAIVFPHGRLARVSKFLD